MCMIGMDEKGSGVFMTGIDGRGEVWSCTCPIAGERID